MRTPAPRELQDNACPRLFRHPLSPAISPCSLSGAARSVNVNGRLYARAFQAHPELHLAHSGESSPHSGHLFSEMFTRSRAISSRTFMTAHQIVFASSIGSSVGYRDMPAAASRVSRAIRSASFSAAHVTSFSFIRFSSRFVGAPEGAQSAQPETSHHLGGMGVRALHQA